MIRAIIFDFGGVIGIETFELRWKAACDKVNIDYSKSLSTAKRLSEDFRRGRINNEEFWIRLLKELEIDDDVSKYKNVLYDVASEVTKTKPKMIKLVNKLQKSGYITALLSNTDENVVRYNKENNRYRHFSPVILSSEVGFAKPDKEIFELMLKKLGLQPEECVFVDDMEVNLIPARELGMKTILFKSPEQLKAELKKLELNF